VLLRCNRKGETIVTLVHAGEPGPLAELRFGARGHYLQRHDAPGNRICSDEQEVVAAGPSEGIRERFLDLDVTIPPTAFWQANADVAEALYDAAAEALEGERLAELFCGAGAAGLLALARRPGATLEGVDRSARAIDAARATALAHGLAERARFVVGGAEEQAGAWDAVLVNPPRAGCHAAVLEAVARSDARRLVYLSCNPATLARDAAALGWTLRWVQPADMLPQTPHLEMLALLTRP
jgi:tRNA/tmRNA/rRNA uracil-C5-methylase (TrmA/RlmC/RlmD family)